MSNRNQLKARLREELGATNADEIWTDALLDDILIESVDWYSRLYPMASTAARDVAAYQRTFDIPAGTIDIRAVECPPGKLLPEEAEMVTADPTPYSGRTRQAWATWGDVLYLRNPASGDEVGASKLVMHLLLPWDRLDPVEGWNGPAADELLLVLWAAKEAWAWLDGLNTRLDTTNGQTGSQVARYQALLDEELAARRRKASSRIIGVVG